MVQNVYGTNELLPRGSWCVIMQCIDVAKIKVSG